MRKHENSESGTERFDTISEESLAASIAPSSSARTYRPSLEGSMSYPGGGGGYDYESSYTSEQDVRSNRAFRRGQSSFD